MDGVLPNDADKSAAEELVDSSSPRSRRGSNMGGHRGALRFCGVLNADCGVGCGEGLDGDGVVVAAAAVVVELKNPEYQTRFAG